MANFCEKLINSCITDDCKDPIFTGVDNIAYIFNKSEIAGFTLDSTNPNIVTAINMKTHTVGSEEVSYTGYKISQLGKTPFTGTNTALVEGNVANTWTNTFNFIVPDNSPEAANIVDNLGNGKFVVVIKNDYKNAYQIYGRHKGLVATATDNDKYSEDTNGGWAITLVEEKAPKSALFLEHKTGTDIDTEAYLEGLVDCE